MDKLRVAIIGCGTIARSAHIPAFLKNPDVELVYFCDIILERAESAVKDYGRGKAVIDYREIIQNGDVDAVSVCTPNHVHAEISIAFLKAGVDVLCEKPAARVLVEALEMQKAQEESGQILNIGVCNRFNTSVERIKKHIENGDLGEVYQVYISFRAHRSIPGLGGDFTRKEIAGGGALIDWGVHFIDLVMYCCGDPDPLTVSGKTFGYLGKDIKNYVYTDMWAGPPNLDGVFDVDDSVTALIRTEGPVINLNGAWAQNIGHNEMFVDFMGDKGGIRLQYGMGYTFFSTKDGALFEETPEFEMVDQYEAEINSFIEAAKTGEKTKANIDYAILTSRIMDAIYKSSDLDEEIKL